MTSQQLHDALSHLPDDLIHETDRRRNAPKQTVPFRRYAAFAASFALVLCSAWLMTRLISPKGGATEEAAAPAAMQYAADTESAMLGAPESENGTPREAAAEEAPASGVQEKAESAAEDSSVVLPTIPEKFASEDTIPVCTSSFQIETPQNPKSTACFSGSYRIKVLTSQAELAAYQAKWESIYDLTGFAEATAGYDESWFETHDLLVMTLHAQPVGIDRTISLLWNTREEDKAQGWDWMFLVTGEDTRKETNETTDYHLLTELEKGLISPEDGILPVFEIHGET